MTEFKIVINQAPFPQKRGNINTKGSTPRFYPANAKYQKKVNALIWALKAARPIGFKPLSGPLEMTLTIYLPKPKSSKNKVPTGTPDSSNCLKNIEDCLQKIWFENDSQIVKHKINKVYADENGPRWEITLRTLEEVNA